MKFRNWMVPVLLVGLAACGEEPGDRVELGEPEQPVRETGRESWSAEFTARVDSANAAYAAGDYEAAKAVFTALSEERPEVGVVWFGLYMAEAALGNDEAAQEALARAESSSPGLGRMHEAATDSTARVPMMMEGHPQMPSGHPSLDSMTGEEDAPPLPEGSGGR